MTTMQGSAVLSSLMPWRSGFSITVEDDMIDLGVMGANV